MGIVNTTGKLIGLDGRPLSADYETCWEAEQELIQLGQANFGDSQRRDRRCGESEQIAASDSEQPDFCEHPHAPALEVADVFRQFGQEYRAIYGDTLSVQQDRALREIMVCRTQVLGFHLWRCDACGAQGRALQLVPQQALSDVPGPVSAPVGRRHPEPPAAG